MGSKIFRSFSSSASRNPPTGTVTLIMKDLDTKMKKTSMLEKFTETTIPLLVGEIGVSLVLTSTCQASQFICNISTAI